MFYPVLPSPDRPLASWLQAHHLTYGLSGSWFASNGVTLYSDGHIRVRDIKLAANGEISRLPWNTKASWYRPGQHDARFIIFNPCVARPTGRLFKVVGPPSAAYLVQGFTVFVWNSNLLKGHQDAASSSAREPAGPPGHTVIASRYTSTYLLMCG